MVEEYRVIPPSIHHSATDQLGEVFNEILRTNRSVPGTVTLSGKLHIEAPK